MPFWPPHSEGFWHYHSSHPHPCRACQNGACFGLAVVLGGLAYAAIVIATRSGDIAAIAPFRYSRLLFAMLIAVIFLGERPDALTLTGAGLIVASGIYAFWRERIRSRMEATGQSA